MGYTHYWNQARDATPAEWGAYCSAVRRLIKNAGVPLAWEYDTPNKRPEVSRKAVRFNGLSRDGHETFCLEPVGQSFAFCKTARKPYDPVVVASLILAAYLLPGFHWSSDGEADDHAEGLALAKQVLPTVTLSKVRT